MPLWAQDCSREDAIGQCAVTIGNLAVIGNQLDDALTAPCETFAAGMGGASDKLIGRLQGQARSLLRKIQTTANQLDALGLPPLPAEGEPMPIAAPQPAQDVFAPLIDTPIQIIGADALGAGGVTSPDAAAFVSDPKEPESVAGFLFGQGQARWHQRAAAWFGFPVTNLLGAQSLRALIDQRVNTPLPAPAPPAIIPDIY